MRFEECPRCGDPVMVAETSAGVESVFGEAPSDEGSFVLLPDGRVAYAGRRRLAAGFVSASPDGVERFRPHELDCWPVVSESAFWVDDLGGVELAEYPLGDVDADASAEVADS